MDHESTIAAGLARIQSEGGNGNFAIFGTGRGPRTYVQVAGARDSTRLLLEVGTPEDPTDAQREALAELGFTDASPMNHWLEWHAGSDSERHSAAAILAAALVRIHGADPGEELEVQVNLE